MGGISTALLIKEQQFLCLGCGEINEQAVASDITAFCGISGKFPDMTELYGSLFVSLIGDIHSRPVRARGAGRER